MDLSNFYKDNAFNYSNFEALFNVYIDLITAANEYAIQIKNNVVIPKIETYRIFPFQRILAEEATYNLNELLSNSKIVDKYILGSVPLENRITMWEDGTFTLAEKLDMLYITNTYITVEAKRGFTNEKNYPIVSIRMFNESGTEVLRNLDYALSMNRIYLLRDMAIPSTGKYITIQEIGVDFNTPRELLGGSLGIDYNEVLTKNEYNEILKVLTAAALGGPTVANLKVAIEAIAGPDQGDLYDKFVRDAKKQARWEATNYTDFDFVVVFPEEYAVNMERLEAIKGYLEVVKPAYTKFAIILQSIYSDTYNILLNANDADNADFITEIIEEIFESIIGEEDSGNLVENATEVYTMPLDYCRLNNVSYKLNTNFKLFGSSAPEQDPHTDTIIPV
jgi:hypothetical protein